MEIILKRQKTESLVEQQLLASDFKTQGLLNSVYKRRTQHNLFNSNPKSIFGIRQDVKRKRYRAALRIDAALKLSIFVITLGFIL
ncbi:MAG: hypothetical protein HRT67_03115 [Flavobacteriaceae bacterium]|nr:hypothetical protein [Flavobacteriaceae bacterium]